MKWIGQHIWDFISRFRSDVYMEGVESGTIASGGNLGLDSNNKIVKAAEVGSSVDLTSEVTGVLPVTNGGTGATTLTSDCVLTGNGGSAIQAEADLKFYPATSLLEVQADSGAGPLLHAANTADDAVSGSLTLANLRDGGGHDDDYVGSIYFQGKDSGTNNTHYARIDGKIVDAADGSEAGSLELKVAENDGTLTTGLKLEGQPDDDGEVDVTIAAGMGSTTTVAGALTVNGFVSTFTNATSTQVIIKNTGNNASGGILDFKNERSAGVDGDTTGLIRFYGNDDGGNAHQVAFLQSQIDETADGSEFGKLLMQIRTGAQQLRQGFSIDSTAGNDIANMSLGYGVTSVTTIAGDLDIDGDNVTAAGALTITPGGAFSIAGGSSEIDLTTTGTLDVNVNSLDMDLTDSSSITVTSSEGAEDLTIEQVGANDSSVIINAAGTGTDAIKLNASGGSIDIDSADNVTVDAADEITLTTTSADGHISLVSAHTSGTAVHIDADAHTGSIVDIDAGVLDIDATNITIDATQAVSIESARAQINQVFDFHAETFENQLGADVGSGTIIKYSPASSSSLNLSEIYYLRATGSWAQALADDVGTTAPMLGVPVGANPQTAGILIKGFVHVNAAEILNLPLSGAVDGLPVYLSDTTAGHFDFTAPSASGRFVRIVGYAIDDHLGGVLIYFDPDKSYIEIA